MIGAPGYAKPNATPKGARHIDVGLRSSDRKTIEWTPLGAYRDSSFEFDWYLPADFEIGISPEHRLIPEIFKGIKRRAVFIRTEENGIEQTYRLMKRRVTGPPGHEKCVLTGFDHRFHLQRSIDWVNNLFPPEFQINITGKQHVVVADPDTAFKIMGAGVWTRLHKPIWGSMPTHQVGEDFPDLDGIDSLDDLLDIANTFANNIAFLQTRFTQLDEGWANTRNRLDIGYSMRVWDGTGPAPAVFNTESLSQLQSVIDATSDNFLNFLNPGNYLGLVDPASWGKAPRAGYIFDTRRKRDRRQLEFRSDGGYITNIDFEETHPDATRAIVGGRAPEILNQVIEWGANFAIQLLLNAIAPGLGLGLVVGDLFDNIFFAYQQFYDDDLEDAIGIDDAFGEVMASNTAAYSLDSYSIAQEALKAHGGGEKLSLDVNSANPDGPTFGVDDGSGRRYDIGDIVTLYDRGVTDEQYVSHMVCSDNLETGRRTQKPSFGRNAHNRGFGGLISNVQNLAGYTRGNDNAT